MEIGKRPEPLPSGDIPSLSKETTKSAEALKPILPPHAGNAKALKDLLASVKEGLREPLPDILHQVAQMTLKEGHLYISGEGVENWALASSALLNQEVPKEIIEKFIEKSPSNPSDLEPRHKEKVRLQVIEKTEATIQRIRSGKILSQQKPHG